MNVLVKTNPMNADRIREDRTRAAMWLSDHLHKLTGVDVHAGVTSAAERLKRLCALLTERGLLDEAIGRFNDRPESYRQFCKRALGINVDVPQEQLL